jgi:hypothetical protein
MKKFGIVVKFLTVAALLALAVAVAGCGDDKPTDTASVDKSVSQEQGSDEAQTKQFDKGQEVGEEGKIVVESDAQMSANQQAVIARLGEFGDATANQNYKKLCNDLLSKESRKIGGNCVKTFTETGRDLKDFKISVNSVTVAKDGKSAVAKVDVSSNVNKTPAPQNMSLIKEGGEWRIEIIPQ